MLTGMPNRLGAAIGLALATVQGGCGSPSAHFRDVCGYKVDIGANDVGFTYLDADESHGPPPVAPAHTNIPSMAPPSEPVSGTDYVRVSKDCGHGAIVTVKPIGGARFQWVIPARDGKPEMIIVHPTASVTVQAWVRNRYQGSADLS